ncbi:MAG: hypothetical protein GF316_20345 [Candidatus Lokiarchaeota archaeon]|nr:hypothetical protein [Candidatus Lokiarchaeota archaeon]
MVIDNLDIYKFECIKCGKDTSKTFFEFTEKISKEKRRSTIIKKKAIKVPVCKNCKTQLEEWVENNSTSRYSYSDLACYYVIGILVAGGGIYYGLFTPTSPHTPPSSNSPALFIGFLASLFLIGGTIYIYHKQKSRKQENSPFRYIKFRGQTTYVKPSGTQNWVEYKRWLNNAVVLDTEKIEDIIQITEQKKREFEEGTNVIYCPQCGEKYHEDTEFCNKCGKNLRDLKQ